VFTAAVTGTAGGEAQGIEDSVSPPASKEMETKMDDAPRNSKELHAHEEYEEIVKSCKLEIKQLLEECSSFRRMTRWRRSGAKTNAYCDARWCMHANMRA
jgi:hypothetical protein